MAASFALRSHPFHVPFLSAATTTTHRNPFLLPLFSTLSSSLTLTSGSNPSSLIHHGPSLSKGRRASLSQNPTLSEHNSNNELLLVKDNFTRVFDLLALRVPAEQCFALESHLRGHLLNWPRIRNIARVPGDDVDPAILKLIRDGDGPDKDRLRSLVRMEDVSGGSGDEQRLPLSPVMYREKLAKEFNSRGFLKFRNLAKMSRPKKKKVRKVEGEEGAEVRDRRGRNSFAVVEVVEQSDDEEDLSGLLGDGFGGGKWRGSTRLLLLDEQYAKKGAEELPEAIKAVLQEDVTKSKPPISEIVKCQLTLFYEYWPMNEILDVLLPAGMIVPTAFETVGHIAHLNLREEHLPYKELIAQVVLDKNMPKIQTVVNKIDAIQNEYRTMQLEVLAGNHSLVTTVIENGIRFHVDLATVYWNSRLATERQRLICSFSRDDVVCDVFAGVGPIAISAAKKVKYVYANDLNPNAVEYLERNIVINKLDRKIEVYNMDGRRFISSIFSSQRPHPITQVVMNLPNDAAQFLDAFRGVFCRRRGEGSLLLPEVHVYGFSKSPNPEFDFHERIKLALFVSAIDVEMHRVRLVAPGKWMLCGSFALPDKVAFAKRAIQF